MNMKVFYSELRDIEAEIPEEYPVVVSESTPWGGKAGVAMEVSREQAAKAIKQRSARLATPEEAAAYRGANSAKRQDAQRRLAAEKVQVTVLTAADLDRLKGE